MKEKTDDPYPKQDLDHTHMENLPAGVRWVSLLGINGWFTKEWRLITSAVPILLVAAFVTAMVQIVANPGYSYSWLMVSWLFRILLLLLIGC